MLPHWSVPPICSVQPYRRYSSTKSMRLQQLVAELGEGQPAASSSRALTDSRGQHLVDREVLADVAQEVDRAEAARSSRGCSTIARVAAVEVEEPRHLPADALDPRGDRLRRR